MRIVKNFIYNTLNQLLLIIIPLITIPYVSRILGAEALGVNAYTYTIATYFVQLANMGLGLYGMREIAYSRNYENGVSKTFLELLILKLIVGVISYGLFLVFVLFYNQYLLVFLLQSIFIISAIFDFMWFFAGIEDFKKITIRNFLIKVLSFILIILFVRHKNDLLIYVLILAGSNLVGNLSLIPYFKKYIKFIPLKQLDVKSHVKPIIILFIPQMILLLSASLNKVYLGSLAPISASGYFDNADKIIRISIVVISSVGTVLFPKIAYYHKRNDAHEVKKYLNISLSISCFLSIPIVAGIIAIATPFSNVFFGESFVGIDRMLSLLSVQLFFMSLSYIIGQQYLVATNETKHLTISTCISLVLLSLTAVTLIPIIGIYGAILAAIVNEAFIAIYQLVYIRKMIDFKTSGIELLKYAIAALVMYMVCRLVSQIIPGSNTISVGVQIIVGGVVYIASVILLRPKMLRSVVKELRSNK